MTQAANPDYVQLGCENSEAVNGALEYLNNPNPTVSIKPTGRVEIPDLKPATIPAGDVTIPKQPFEMWEEAIDRKRAAQHDPADKVADAIREQTGMLTEICVALNEILGLLKSHA